MSKAETTERNKNFYPFFLKRINIFSVNGAL